eukprot:888169-Amphidinium_carterae.1
MECIHEDMLCSECGGRRKSTLCEISASREWSMTFIKRMIASSFLACRSKGGSMYSCAVGKHCALS